MLNLFYDMLWLLFNLTPFPNVSQSFLVRERQKLSDSFYLNCFNQNLPIFSFCYDNLGFGVLGEIVNVLQTGSARSRFIAFVGVHNDGYFSDFLVPMQNGVVDGASFSADAES
jgi:hypothetical protein